MNESKVIEFLREKLKDARDFANKVGDVFYATHISEPDHGPHANWAYGFRDDLEKALSRAGVATPGLEEVLECIRKFFSDIHGYLRLSPSDAQSLESRLTALFSSTPATEAEAGEGESLPKEIVIDGGYQEWPDEPGEWRRGGLRGDFRLGETGVILLRRVWVGDEQRGNWGHPCAHHHGLVGNWKKLTSSPSHPREECLREELAADRSELAEARGELEAEKADHNDFLAFMYEALARWSCGRPDCKHENVPPMMWPELIAEIVAEATKGVTAEVERLRWSHAAGFDVAAVSKWQDDPARPVPDKAFTSGGERAAADLISTGETKPAHANLGGRP